MSLFGRPEYMAQFFNNSKIRFRELKGFLLQHAERVIQHAIDVAKQEGRPFRYLQEKIRKEELAKEIAARDQIQDGLSCVFSALEPCRTFSSQISMRISQPSMSLQHI